MTSVWKERAGRDDRPDQAGEPDENQLDLFAMTPRANSATERLHVAGECGDAGAGLVELHSAESGAAESHFAEVHLVDSALAAHRKLKPSVPTTLDPTAVDSDILNASSVDPGDIEMSVGQTAARNVLDAGVSDSDDLRRLEESIQWLMNAGTAPLPRTAPLRPVTGLSPLAREEEDDALLLDPETLFPPHAPRRSSGIAAGAAKILLVSAIAAPTAYFVASWLQFPGAVAPSDAAAVSGVATPAALSGDTMAAAMAPVMVSAPAAAALPPPIVSSVPQAEHSAVEVSPAPEPTVAPRPDAAPQPTGRAAEVIVAAVAATHEPPAAGKAEPAEAVNPPMPFVLPAKPVVRQEEIAMMVERGRLLFEAGDLAAARLFFRRAANAGDAAAAIAMGATYDPDVLTQRFIRGIEADPREAQKWYERAREMGGQQRVEMLAQRR
jgi:hypothetical protein